MLAERSVNRNVSLMANITTLPLSDAQSHINDILNQSIRGCRHMHTNTQPLCAFFRLVPESQQQVQSTVSGLLVTSEV